MPQESEQGPCGPFSVLRMLVNPEGLTGTENTECQWWVRAQESCPLSPCNGGAVGPGTPPQEDPVLRPHLPDELAPFVHADVFLTLSTLDAHTAPKGVRLYYELGCHEGETSVRGLQAQGVEALPTPPTHLTPNSGGEHGEAPTQDPG